MEEHLFQEPMVEVIHGEEVFVCELNKMLEFA